MGASEVESFLNYLTVDREVAAPTQNQAFSALLFPFRANLLTLPCESLIRHSLHVTGCC